MEAFKKIKQWRLAEHLGGLFITLCVACYFLYFDYASILGKIYRGGEIPEPLGQRFDVLGEDGSECDLFEGEWVWDETYPLYNSADCSFLDEGFRCNENGRPDFLFSKWRWQPNRCNLPRFDAKKMLEHLRDKRIVFAGDSIGRNQWESLLCMLSSSVEDKASIYEINGSPITKHNGYLSFKFAEYNFSVEYYRSPFLVMQNRPPPGVPEQVKMTIRLDEMDWYEDKWRDADVVVFNSGHWWNYEKTIRSGSYFEEAAEVKQSMEIETAYRKATETVVKWMQRRNNSLVFYRTFAPVHFRGGDWRSGGSCHLETVPDLGPSLVPSETWRHFEIANELLSSSEYGKRKFRVLNVTSMAARRKDGHPSVYYLRPHPAPRHRQDCSHWCLPGVPDAWNELLYALLLKS